ncbi:MAG TPA: class I SAM-dependent methyltransferase [Candidatus Nanoarchaeia archaeon]|nr:class I SAM-dependent methyltransferase [Candidatus Nanoarchaeia archaeon]
MYSHLSNSYDELHRLEQERKIKLILNSIEIKKSDKILDVGCGTALILDCLKDFNKDFREYAGIDNSSEMLEIARKRIKKEKKVRRNIKFIQADAENLPVKDKSFDIALSITAIHNFKNPEKALDEIIRATKKTAVVTILKKSSRFSEIKNEIRSKFDVVREIGDDKDVVFVLKMK